VQVDPIKPTLKASGTKRLKLECDEPISDCAFKFNLRRYILGEVAVAAACTAVELAWVIGRGLHLFTLELNLSNSRIHL